MRQFWVYSLITPFLFLAFFTNIEAASLGHATTTLDLSICGNSIVDTNEQCDVPGETGTYSTTIVGRQCTPSCLFGPYCGDGILQTIHGEQCDDGNNDDGDFCSSECTIEPAGSGGGGSSGGGPRGGGGSDRPLNQTTVSVSGKGYPGRTINILLDSDSVGSVTAGSNGSFNFSTEVSPGPASLGFWSTDTFGTRSITYNTTFDVTQGAVTNVNGVIIPPTIRVANAKVDPGAEIRLYGQSVPGAAIEVHFDDSDRIEDVVAASNGVWELIFNTSLLSIAEHTVRARSITGNPPLTTESSFSSSIQLFVGVDGKATSPSDLNRDGSVDLIDFSILIFWWRTNGGNSNPPADINQNGNVGLEDFSILLFNWTG
ncbi:DUF4215 domain-containing protein [Candidatus Kaiserbacteria bacterium]|nr:DUF4215 domain-containing protein [Candidatus Kaiserbacteria bacterium]